MYLSIGSDMAVRDTSIIGIFHMDNTTTSKRTREFLNQAEKEGQVIPCDDLPKSFILTAEYGFQRVYLTSLSSYTHASFSHLRAHSTEAEPLFRLLL